MIKIYLIVGEMSGDFIGSNLMTSLKNIYELEGKKISFVGVGGRLMEEAGLENSLFSIRKINMMGFLEIVPHIFQLLKLINITVDDITDKKPDLLITIDSPGFTYRVAKKIRQFNPNLKILHIVAPSVWAYKPFRALKYAKVYNCLFTLLPFEPPYFHKVGLDCRYIGHPIMEQNFYENKDRAREELLSLLREELASWPFRKQQQCHSELHSSSISSPINFRMTNNEKTRWSSLLALLRYDKNISVGSDSVTNHLKTLCVTCGSRKGEIIRHVPVFTEAINIVVNKYPNLVVIFVITDHSHQELIESFLTKASFIYYFSTDRLKVFAASDIALAKSGTNTLEMAASGTPMIVTYKVNILSYLLIKCLIKIKYVSLINIIADREILPELIQYNCTCSQIAAGLISLLDNQQKANTQLEESKKILMELGFKSTNSPSNTAAKIIRSLIK